jgi:succinoglycan biosynthesis transport protein ExoP
MRPERGVPLERMFLQDRHNAFSESIRTIRSDVLLSMLDTPRKILLLTSAVPHEGKTTVSCNLAFALSEVARTVLVEADMRRPKIDKVFNERGTHPGLSELVAGRATLPECLYQPENSSLQVLQAGRVPLNPLELLSSKRFAEVLNQLATQFDVVLMDSAPVQLVSDALVLSKLATAVLLPGGAEQYHPVDARRCAAAWCGTQPDRPGARRCVPRRIQRLRQRVLPEVRVFRGFRHA